MKQNLLVSEKMSSKIDWSFTVAHIGEDSRLILWICSVFKSEKGNRIG